MGKPVFDRDPLVRGKYGHFRKLAPCKNFFRTGRAENRQCSGTVLILFAFLMPVFLFIAGAAVDVGRAFVCKAEINKACMIAAEEASKEIDIDNAQVYGFTIIDAALFKESAAKYFYENVSPKENFNIEALEVNIIDSASNPEYISIKCISRIDCFFLKAAGIDSIAVSSSATGRLRKIK